MLPQELELLKVQLELDAETIEIDEELVDVLKARKKMQQKPSQAHGQDMAPQTSALRTI